MMDIEPAFIKLSLNEQPVIAHRRADVHSNRPFFDTNAPVTCCNNRYCFSEHGKEYIWVTEHHCQRPARTFRQLFEDLLDRRDNTIPILGNLYTTAIEIRDKLIEGHFDLNGFDKVQVTIRAGHFFSLFPMVDGRIEITEEERGFGQQWPLFADVEIYAQEATLPTSTCQVLITVEKFGSGGEVHPEAYVLLQEIAMTPRHHFGGMGGITVAQ